MHRQNFTNFDQVHSLQFFNLKSFVVKTWTSLRSLWEIYFCAPFYCTSNEKERKKRKSFPSRWRDHHQKQGLVRRENGVTGTRALLVLCSWVAWIQYRVENQQRHTSHRGARSHQRAHCAPRPQYQDPANPRPPRSSFVQTATPCGRGRHPRPPPTPDGLELTRHRTADSRLATWSAWLVLEEGPTFSLGVLVCFELSREDFCSRRVPHRRLVKD